MPQEQMGNLKRKIGRDDVEKPAKTKRPQKSKHAASGTTAKSTRSKSEKKAAEGAAKSKTKKNGTGRSELDALKEENAALKAQLAAANARVDYLLSVTKDVTARLDAVIALIRGLVKS